MFYFLAQQDVVTTNNVAHLSEAVSQEMGKIQQAINTIIEWFTVNGVQFAVQVLYACVIFLVGVYLIRMLSFSVRKAIQKSHRLNPLLEAFICNLVTKVGWLFLLIIVLEKLNVSTTSLVAGASVTGIIVGFAFQESLSNFAAGLMIAVNQPFKEGDFVSAGDISGSVAELNMMATTLLTPDYKRVTVPNKVIWGNAITNFSAMGRRRVELSVNITYGSNIPKVKQVALDTINAIPLVFKDPAPLVEIMALTDSSLTLVMRPWCQPADYWKVHFALTSAIKEAFDRNGIAFAFPHRTVFLRQDAPPVLVRDGDRT